MNWQLSLVILVIGAILVGYTLATLAGWTTPAESGASSDDHHEVTRVAHFWAVIPFMLLLAAIGAISMSPGISMRPSGSPV